MWKELKAQGYAGAYSTLSEALKYYGIAIGKKAGQNKRLPPPAGASFKPSTTAIWFVSDQVKLRESQRSIVDKLCAASAEIGSAFSLAQNFRKMMVDRTGDKELRGWIDQSTDSGIKQLAAFAKGLSTDYHAVENALTLKWSNGPVEGNANRLKTIKRQMYGRAGLDLLKRRVVYSPP